MKGVEITMIYWKNNSISDKQDQVIKSIYKYRALTNEHLRKLIFGHLHSNPNGQKANISRYTSDLKKKKLIQSFSCYPYSKELIHCLTPKGVEYFSEFVLTDSENPMAGFKDYTPGDFDAGILKPGLKNLEHTMMYLDFAINFRNKLDIRHNLYAVKEYLFYDYDNPIGNSVSAKVKKVRPDGEILREGMIFSLEIDTGSERFGSLLEKFLNYKRYFDRCIEEEIEPKWSGMLLVCKKSNLEFSRDQRLHTILKAACQGLQCYSWTFPIHIFQRKNNVILSELLINNKNLLEAINIPIPVKSNTVLEEFQRREEMKIREEEERKRRQDEAQRLLKEKLERERAEYEKKKLMEEAQRKREIEEQKKKENRFFGIRKLLS